MSVRNPTLEGKGIAQPIVLGRVGRVRVLKASVWLPASVDRVFEFFADAHNLQSITPEWLSFRVLTPGPIEMGEGTLIDYRISLRGLPMRWRTRISVWEPGVRFVDEQVRGPYRLWRHEHTFRAHEGGTMCGDRVEYAHLGGAIGERLIVRRDLARIFEHRQRRMLELFPPM
ncbi:MAG: SRPBCC family protein [Phycisphaerales bacterium]|nr:SRPBCC family protein [Phycisphaerales bacterium]